MQYTQLSELGQHSEENVIHLSKYLPMWYCKAEYMTRPPVSDSSSENQKVSYIYSHYLSGVQSTTWVD